jgi:hypothetical protein
MHTSSPQGCTFVLHLGGSAFLSEQLLESNALCVPEDAEPQAVVA